MQARTALKVGYTGAPFVSPPPESGGTWRGGDAWTPEWVELVVERARDWRARQAARPQVIQTDRYWELDALRGLAVGLMVVYHALISYSAAFFPALTTVLLEIWTLVKTITILGGVSWLAGTALQSPEAEPPEALRRWMLNRPGARALLKAAGLALTAGLIAWMAVVGSGGIGFMFIMGISMALSYARAVEGGQLKFPAGQRDGMAGKYLRRGLLLLAMGLGVTVLSLLLLPQYPIYFGVLSLLGASTILAYPFLKLPYWASLGAGSGAVALGYLPPLYGLWQAGMAASLDFYPLFPFTGAVLLGVGLGKLLYPNGERAYKAPNLSDTKVGGALSWLGRNALGVYLGQEPFFIAGMTLVV